MAQKKKETNKIEDTSSKDLELITKMNQEFAKSLDLKETLNNSLELIIKRINAQAANIFLIFLFLMEIIIHAPNFYLHITDAILFVQYCINGLIDLSSQIKL